MLALVVDQSLSLDKVLAVSKGDKVILPDVVGYQRIGKCNPDCRCAKKD
jgi:hypothetical protein